MPPTSVGGIFRVGAEALRGVSCFEDLVAGALPRGLFRGNFAASQAIPDHIFRPTEKAFIEHINEKCPPRPG